MSRSRPPGNYHSVGPYLALAGLSLIAAVAAGAWLACQISHVLAGTPGPRTANPFAYVIGLAAGDYNWPGIVASVVAVVEFGLVVAVVTLVVRGWTRRQRDWRVKIRSSERDLSPIWAKPKDIEPLRFGQNDSLDGRIMLGELMGADSTTLATPRFTSLAVVAPTGSAKTAKYVVPTILRWSDSMLVTSTKSDVVDLTINHRAFTRKRPAFIFDPNGEWPEHLQQFLCAWSPLMAIEDFTDADKVAMWLAEAADVKDDPEGRFWVSLAQIAMGPVLWTARKTDRNMQDVAEWISNRSFAEVTELLEEYGKRDLSPQERLDLGMAKRGWASTEKRGGDALEAVFSVSDFVLKPFTSPQMRTTTEIKFDENGKPYSPNGRAVLDMELVLDEGGTIYVVGDEEEQELLLPVFQSVTQAFLRACRRRQRREGTGPLRNPPLLLLEEAANVAPLKTLDKMAATYRGVGIVIMSIWQDEAQVSTIYDTRAATVLGNHTTRVYLPGSSDIQTLERLSRLIGDQPVAQFSASSSKTTWTVSEGTDTMNVAPVEYLRTLPADVAVVLSGRLPPMRVTALPWFKDPEMRALIGAETCRRYDQAFGASTPAAAQPKSLRTRAKRKGIELSK